MEESAYRRWQLADSELKMLAIHGGGPNDQNIFIRLDPGAVVS